MLAWPRLSGTAAGGLVSFFLVEQVMTFVKGKDDAGSTLSSYGDTKHSVELSSCIS